MKSLPSEWQRDRLKDIVTLRNEKTAEKSEDLDYIELEDIESGSGRLLNKRNTLEVESAVTMFQKGDVLFGKLRPYLEKYWQADADGKCTGEILAFKPDRIDAGYLRYCIASPWFIQLCAMLAYGTKMPRVNWPTQLATFDIPLPPADEQHRIAAYLDASCRAIDAAVAAKRRQIETLAEVLRSTIVRAVTQGTVAGVPVRNIGEDWIGELPAHWRIVRIKRVLQRMDYGISESTNPEGRFPVLKMGHLQNGEIDYAKLDFVDVVDDELLLETGDILYNRTNSPDQVGKAAIYRKCKDDDITFASYLVRLRFNHQADAEYMNFVLNSESFLNYVRRLAIPSVQQSNLNSTRYGRMLVPLPPLREQKAIAQYLVEKTESAESVRTLLETQIQTLTAYRKSLIHECVTGQRRLTEQDLNHALGMG